MPFPQKNIEHFRDLSPIALFLSIFSVSKTFCERMHKTIRQQLRVFEYINAFLFWSVIKAKNLIAIDKLYFNTFRNCEQFFYDIRIAVPGSAIGTGQMNFIFLYIFTTFFFYGPGEVVVPWATTQLGPIPGYAAHILWIRSKKILNSYVPWLLTPPLLYLAQRCPYLCHHISYTNRTWIPLIFMSYAIYLLIPWKICLHLSCRSLEWIIC